MFLKSILKSVHMLSPLFKHLLVAGKPWTTFQLAIKNKVSKNCVKNKVHTEEKYKTNIHTQIQIDTFDSLNSRIESYYLELNKD